jgi:cytoskeletal protein RodZ
MATLVKFIVQVVGYVVILFLGYVWVQSSIEEQEKSTRPYTKDQKQGEIK